MSVCVCKGHFWWRQTQTWRHLHVTMLQCWDKFSNVLVHWRIRMIRAKNYETVSKFVKVMTKILWPLFSRTQCICTCLWWLWHRLKDILILGLCLREWGIYITLIQRLCNSIHVFSNMGPLHNRGRVKFALNGPCLLLPMKFSLFLMHRNAPIAPKIGACVWSIRINSTYDRKLP